MDIGLKVKVVKDTDKAVALLDGAYRVEQTLDGRVVARTKGFRSFEAAAREAIALGWR